MNGLGPTLVPASLMRALQDIDRDNLTNGVICFVLSLTAPMAILLAAGRQGGLSESQISGIAFAGYGLGGLITIVASLVARKPYAVLWTIPGMTLLADALEHISYPEAVGAFIISGVLTIALALTGWIARFMRLLPTPIVMGMLAGVFLPYGIRLFPAFAEHPLLGFATVLPFIITLAAPSFQRWLPPLLAAMIGGAVYAVAGGDLRIDTLGRAPLALMVTQPEIIMPAFSLRAMLELVLPITATVIGVHNAQAFVVLRRTGHDPAVTPLTVVCGASTLLFAVFGCVPGTMASLISAITTASGEPRRQYVSTALFGAFVFMLGLFAPAVIALALALPPTFAALLAGLAMLKILEGAFSATFGGRCRLGGLVALLFTMSGLAPLGIGSAFWALVAGYATSWLFERDDLRSFAASQ